MKKSASLFMALALISGSASAAIVGSESHPETNEIALAPSVPWGNAGVQSQSFIHNLPGRYAGVAGYEMVGRHTRSMTFAAPNQTYTHTMGIYNTNNGALLAQSPALSMTAPDTHLIDFSWGFMTIGGNHYSVETMYSYDQVTGAMGDLKVQVVQHPATGALIKKFVRTFPAVTVDGTIDQFQCVVKDINGDGVEEIVVKYAKRAPAPSTQRIRTFLVHNAVTGVFVRKFTITTPS